MSMKQNTLNHSAASVVVLLAATMLSSLPGFKSQELSVNSRDLASVVSRCNLEQKFKKLQMENPDKKILSVTCENEITIQTKGGPVTVKGLKVTQTKDAKTEEVGYTGEYVMENTEGALACPDGHCERPTPESDSFRSLEEIPEHLNVRAQEFGDDVADQKKQARMQKTLDHLIRICKFEPGSTLADLELYNKSKKSNFHREYDEDHLSDLDFVIEDPARKLECQTDVLASLEGKGATRYFNEQMKADLEKMLQSGNAQEFKLAMTALGAAHQQLGLEACPAMASPTGSTDVNENLIFSPTLPAQPVSTLGGKTDLNTSICTLGAFGNYKMAMAKLQFRLSEEQDSERRSKILEAMGRLNKSVGNTFRDAGLQVQTAGGTEMTDYLSAVQSEVQQSAAAMEKGAQQFAEYSRLTAPRAGVTEENARDGTRVTGSPWPEGHLKEVHPGEAPDMPARAVNQKYQVPVVTVPKGSGPARIK
jgi:hypothetical protein